MLTSLATEIPEREQNGNTYSILANKSWNTDDTKAPTYYNLIILQDILELLLVLVLKRNLRRNIFGNGK